MGHIPIAVIVFETIPLAKPVRGLMYLEDYWMEGQRPVTQYRLPTLLTTPDLIRRTCTTNYILIRRQQAHI